MEDLIKALQILARYDNPSRPLHCEHDTLYVMVDPDIVDPGDKAKLDALGLFDGGDGYFKSFRFGSA